MKKIISLILALTLVFSMTTFVSANSPKVNLTYVPVDDTNFAVEISLEGNPGFVSFAFTLNFDKYAVSPVKFNMPEKFTEEGSFMSNVSDIKRNPDKHNSTTVLYYSTGNDYTEDEVVGTVMFKFKDAIPADKQGVDTVISVDLESIDVCNAKLEDVSFTVGTSVTVKTPATEREPEPGEYDEEVEDTDNKDYTSIVGSLTNKGETTEKTEKAEEEKVYTAEVKNVADQNKAKYMAMYEDGTFKPDAPATRYEVIEALDNLFEITSEEFAPAFADVSEKYKLTVQKFVTAKILNGYTDGTFKGDNTITRAEFVKILAVAFDMKLDETATADFTDIAGHWSENYVKTFVSGGYTKGYAEADGTFTFRPEGKVTRAEVVAFVNRIIKAEGEAAEKLPTDLLVDGANHWAYDEIVKVVK